MIKFSERTGGISEAHREVALRGIVDDSRFDLRVMLDSQRRGRVGVVPMMAVMPLLALTLHEIRRWMRVNEPSVVLPTEDAGMVESLRNSTKWFDADRSDVEASLIAFDEIVDSQKSRFLGNARFKWAQRFEGDVGIFKYSGTPYLTTHGVAYAIEKDPTVTFEDLGPRMRALGGALSSSAVLLLGGAELADKSSFIGSLEELKLGERNPRSEKFYGKALGLSLPMSGYLHAVWTQLAFSRMLSFTPLDEDKPTALKYRIVILGHALTALSRLEKDGDPVARRLLADRPAFATGDGYRQLRNVLVHFTPHSAMSPDELDLNLPLFGLLQHHLGVDFDTATEMVDGATAALHQAMGKALGH